jgi:hypothetical protein
MVSNDLPDDIDEETRKRLMARVLQAEKEKLYMDNPQGINQDIKAIIEEEIK